MSEQEENPEGEEEVQEVRTVLKSADIQKGLSKIERTHGKSFQLIHIFDAHADSVSSLDGSSFAFSVLNLIGGEEGVLEDPI